MTRSPSCAICERPGPFTAETLCPACASYPALANAFAEGRARKAATLSADSIVPPPKSLDCGS